MAIAYKNSTTFAPVGSVNPSPTAAALFITPPADLAVGDYLVISVVYQVLIGNGDDRTPLGFTKLNTIGTTAGRLIGTYGQYISDASIIPTLLSGIPLVADGTSSTRVAAVALTLTGVDPTNPLASFGGVVEVGATGSSLSLPATTGDYIFSCAYANNGGGTGQTIFASENGSALANAAATSTTDLATAAATTLSVVTGGTTLTATPPFANAGGHNIGLRARTETSPPPAVVSNSTTYIVGKDNKEHGAALTSVVVNGNILGVEQPEYSTDGKVYTISDLFSTRPFYSAHRGSGGNWPEHTMVSYSNAVRHGMKAIEISACATSDKVLFCQHDLSMARTTGVSATAASLPWDSVKDLTVTAAETDNPSQPRANITLLKDVLDRYAESHVIFMEDKQGSNALEVLDLMDSYKDSTQHFIWKQWAGAGQYNAAVSRGYKAWGYFQTQDFVNFELWAPRFQIIGIHTGCTDDQFRQAVAFCKTNNVPLICWEIHTPEQRKRVLDLGVDGLMTANILKVMRTPM